MPEATLDAVADHGEVTRRHRRRDVRAAQAASRLTAAGIDIDDVVQVLEVEGVEKFDGVLGRAARQSPVAELKRLAQARAGRGTTRRPPATRCATPGTAGSRASPGRAAW